MSIETLILLAGAIFVLGATPGPCVFAIIARGLSMGFGPSLVFILGVIAGDIVFLVLAILGLSFIASQFAGLFLWVKVAGGLYLIWLGISLWRAEPKAIVENSAVERKRRGFFSGLVLTLGNPKAIVFYAAFLPTFMDLGAVTLPWFFAIAAVVAVTLFITLSFFAYFSARSRRLFQSTRALRNLNRGAGTVMVGAGAVVASS